MTGSKLDQRVEAVRRFNRFYTQQIGVLQQRLLRSPFSLTEVRVLYELGHRDEPAAADLRHALGLDAGYLSRILRAFQRSGLIETQRSASDARRTLLRLSDAGRDALAALDARAHDEVAAMLRKLPAPEQRRCVEAMRTIQALLGATPERKQAYVLRPHQPGDLGWVVHRHGVLYAREYGWDERFEALVAEIAAQFLRGYDAKRERCWIAEQDGESVGSVLVVARSKRVAQLRLLLVEPSARGSGIGSRLVDECVRFGRQAGYRKLTLWTNHVLHAARRIYEAAGFRLVREEPHTTFGPELIGQMWELRL